MASCINVSTVIKVSPDGSGFIEETVVISHVLLQQLGGMITGMAESMGATEESGFELPGLFDEEKLEARAVQYGVGVQYVSGEKIVTQRGEGYRATYYFSDINSLEVDQNPSEKVGESPMGQFGAVPKQCLTFQLEQGSPNTLVVRMPRGSHSVETSEVETAELPFTVSDTGGQPDPQMMAMFQTFFEDMRIAVSLEIQGNIRETNATHCDGSKVTIMELDFGELLADADGFAGLQTVQVASLEGARSLIQDLPGMKVDLNEELIIRFD
jgi:hypothetical protein